MARRWPCAHRLEYVLLMPRRVERRRGFTRLSPKRQITLPLAVVERANLRIGEELSVDTDEVGRVIVTRTGNRELGERRRRALERRTTCGYLRTRSQSPGMN